jgi:arsenate reductase
MSLPVRNILFLCTGNSARSILAESIANKLGRPRFRAFSAGSHPTGKVNPDAIELLIDLGYETARLRSKSWTEFTMPGAPTLDIVITVCDSAAKETCPVWPGHPLAAHWGMSDPATAKGRGARSAFAEAYRLLELRISALVELPFDELDTEHLRGKLREIGSYGMMAIML